MTYCKASSMLYNWIQQEEKCKDLIGADFLAAQDRNLMPSVQNARKLVRYLSSLKKEEMFSAEIVIQREKAFISSKA